MNAATKTEALDRAGLQKLRAEVPDNLISYLPKPTKAQNDPNTKREWVRCKVCGGYHHPQVVHLEYVGHAATTHILLDADLDWSWEPVAWTPEGLPAFDNKGGLWIKLTVCGKTRLGYGNAASKESADPGSREKEVIGDAIRNAAMRFGVALDLWSKADLRGGPESERESWFNEWVSRIRHAKTVGDLRTLVAQAIEEAKARGDQEAEDDFLIEQANKMAKAQAKPAGSATPATQKADDQRVPAAGPANPPDESDIPY
jgi:hypothetical protein